MKSPSISLGAVLGFVTSIPVLALSYLASQTLPVSTPAFDLFDWVARTLPGGVVTLGIDTLISLIQGGQLGPTSEVAKSLERLGAVVVYLILGAIFGALLAYLSRRSRFSSSFLGALGGFLWAVVFLFVRSSLGFRDLDPLWFTIWIGGLYIIWGILLGWLIEAAPAALANEPDAPMSRRGFLSVVGGSSLLVTLGSLGLARQSAPAPPAPVTGSPPELDLSITSGPAASPPPEELAARIEPTPGTRMELTPNDEFYTIDINSFPENIDPETWRLEITGLVDNPLSLTLEDLRAYPSSSQVITLSCISNPIGGDLIGTSLWGGVQVKRVLEDAGIQPEAQSLFIEATDGFYESVDLALTEDDRTLFVYEMNGVPLPVDHGFPLRIYIPDRYGMKQPKWISRIEVINHSGPGYWVDRGWSQEALVNTTSVIDDVSVVVNEDGSMASIGGIAYAGAKGISRVEVQVDDAEWMEAELRSPPLSPLTWIQWRLDQPLSEGRHDINVRCYDASGRLQETGSRGARPDGATGVHNFSVTV